MIFELIHGVANSSDYISHVYNLFLLQICQVMFIVVFVVIYAMILIVLDDLKLLSSQVHIGLIIFIVCQYTYAVTIFLLVWVKCFFHDFIASKFLFCSAS